MSLPGAMPSQTTIGWTDVRKETAKRLWLEGRSATQISKELGGVSRSSVLGVIHRSGLSGRQPPSTPGASSPKPKPEMRRNGKGMVGRVFEPTNPSGIKIAVRKAQGTVGPKLICVPDPKGEPEPPLTIGIGLLDLKSHHCRWPLNSAEPWRFCAARKKDDGPYCQAHARKAYQPPQGKKNNVTELTRSLRRYA